jgi:lysophospholipase L1-like esterase
MKFKVRLLLIFVIGLLICLLINSKIEAYQHDKADVVMFGDSLTENGKWDKLFPDIKVVNLGFGGDTTHKMLRRMGEVYKHNPKYCFVMAGFNDIDQGRDLNEIYKDYTSILKKLKNRKIIPIILSTTYVIDHFRTPALINTKVDALNGELKEYAFNNKIIFIDLSQSFSKNHYLSPDFAVDQVHLNDKAYEIWRNKIKNIIYKN